MRKYFLILFYFLLFLNLKAQDSTAIDSVILKKISKFTQPDSINCIKNINEDSFCITYQGFLGALVGSMLAAVIAIYSIHKTHKNHKECAKIIYLFMIVIQEKYEEAES